MIEKLVIIGVGLIGGSLSLALKQAGVVNNVVGCDRSPQNLQKGVDLGVIDSFELSISEAVKTADVVVVAVPLGAMHMVFQQICESITDHTIVTDVGSSKRSVVEVARQTMGDRFPQFVPGHPIAGAEKSGVEAGFASLFQNRSVILTPVKETDNKLIERVDSMWRHCGAIIEYLDVDHHDRVLGATSHLPHMLAYAMVNYLSGLNDHDEIFRYAAGGFRDFTRIASSDPVMWRDVCLSNGNTLLKLIEGYQDELDMISKAIQHNDADQLLQLFGKAKSERDSLIGNC
ncbi:MAG: prephenate dehydrogenase/arogenate dehydrogenase family protein [Gammaproteobacteria bacterium]|nr:prephenate dehydrogenase/arogenate dehydrogenase family protein [Gammaproteobacteria bacterium]